MSELTFSKGHNFDGECRSLPAPFDMKVNNSYSEIWKISYPIILGSLATTVLNLTDTAFLARVGEVELGAMAVAGVFYFVMVMVGIALGTGTQIIMARRAGEGNNAEIGRLFDHSFLMLLVIAIGMFLIQYFGAPILFSSILKSERVINACISFMSIRSLGIIFTMIAISFRSFFIGISMTRVITYSAILMMISNVILAYVFIFGKFGFPAMGIKGAALASVLAELISVLYLIVYCLSHKGIREFRLFRFENPGFERIRSILTIASPVVLQNTISIAAWFLFFVVIERMGEHQLAISNVIRATYMILMTPIWGFASATNSMVSNLVGQGKNDEVRSLVKKIVNLSIVTTLALFLATFVSPQWLLRITTSDIRLIDDSMGCYYIIVGAMFLFSVSVILLNAVSGLGATRAAMYIELVNIFIYVLYVYLCGVVWMMSIEVVWFSEILYWIFMGGLSIMFLNYKKWRPVSI